MTSSDPVVDVSQDWLQACSVQERFMLRPARQDSRIDCSATCRQMRALGGDCYDFTSLADGRLAMLVGDASGKGAAAALMMAGVQASLRTASLFTGDNLPALLQAVNRQVCFSSLADRYVTLFCGLLDPVTRTLRFMNAGHTPAVILGCDGSARRLEPTGPPVGLFSDAVWQEQTVRLESGDRIIACTDGVTEATDRSGEEWGLEGLLAAAAAHASAEATVRSIFDAVDGFTAGEPSDDATVAVVRLA